MSNVFSVHQRTCLISHTSAYVGAIRRSVTGPLRISSNRRIRVHIYEVPYELQDGYILQKLETYGVMTKNELFSHKYLGTYIYYGVRSATFTKRSKPIPQYYLSKVEYDSHERTPICGTCRTKWHFRDDCPRLREVRNLGDLIEPGKSLPVHEIRPFGKSATIRESSHGVDVCKEHYA